MNFGFIGPSYTSRSLAADCQRCVNLYPEPIESGAGKSRVMLVGAPGLATWATLPTTPVRGIWESNGEVLAVAGAKLYRLKSGATYTELGTVATGTGPVTAVHNGSEWFICSEKHGYLWDGSTLAAAGPSSPVQVVFVDGYFVAFDDGTQKFYISGLYDGATWSALEFASAESDPDDLVSMLADHRELWMFGSRSIEVFINTGNPDFPFERVQGAVIEQGCGAAFSPVKMDNSIFWLGGDSRGGLMVWRANGYTPVRVSTHAIEHAWAGYSRTDDAFAYAYSDEGHSFYQITFPTAKVRTYPHATVTVGATWVYDAATGAWHERGVWDSGLGDYRQHRALSHCYAWGKHLVGSRDSGVIYEQHLDTRTDGGEALRWMRTAPHLAANGKRAFFNSLRLDLEAGVGLTSGQGSDPQVMMQFSDDGGRTWSNERWVSAGKKGEYTKRAIWNRLGSARDRVFRVAGSDPVQVALIEADIDVQVGNH